MLLNRPKPIADQINELLRERIRNRDYKPGDRLPSESELAGELGVSRATLRTALAKLAADGLIIRRQGDGTFINQRLDGINTSLGGMLDFWRLTESSGLTPSIQTISIAERAATADETQALQLDAESPVISLVRLFLADQQPYILAMNVIPVSLFVNQEDLYDGRLPLNAFLERYCRRVLQYAIYDIESAPAGDKAAEFLKRELGAPLIALSTTFYDEDNAPIVYGKSFYNDQVMALRFVQSWV